MLTSVRIAEATKTAEQERLMATQQRRKAEERREAVLRERHERKRLEILQEHQEENEGSGAGIQGTAE